ncbi:MAG: bifunctional phosphopantothenoylcysteine decarboxylase/phosphopantothenate--cysteine ligase CoaBC [Frankiaceae bacterium]|nr:bifunctional phosphopantothenoylcysteine decarboxylase/phosphopantothenate--cysteine ligase CoaBC [Frankiaceae bacterium]MBV9869251.1 bifunctional phosphopantothenoylcysteine decarboxylase/phosphopantothenate--cysteine ligase CoaBC [Frankiaceae bacterium]
MAATGTRPRVVLGVCGGIAAYKACELLRRFTESGHDVRVLPTQSALKFVGETTWAALSGNPVVTDVFTDAHDVPHVAIGRQADLVVVAPATADFLARMVIGRSDDLLTATLLTARCPVVIAPAMHTEMWEHAATQANVATLRERGVIVLTPAIGRLTGADTGIGRLPEPGEIFAVAQTVLARGGAATLDLAGRHVVVSAGGTREPLDPVRFLGNRSSGRQGFALARAALARGAEVTLVAANAALPDPAGAKVVRVGTAEEMRTAVLEVAPSADAIVMAAAVADFRPMTRAASKLKKGDADPAPIALTRNADILAEISTNRGRGGQVIVGFAAETDDVIANGRKKLAAKGCDLMVINEVGEHRAFDTEENAATILGADGTSVVVPQVAKESLAHAIWDLVVARLAP